MYPWFFDNTLKTYIRAYKGFYLNVIGGIQASQVTGRYVQMVKSLVSNARTHDFKLKLFSVFYELLVIMDKSGVDLNEWKFL